MPMTAMPTTQPRCGKLAAQGGYRLPLRVLHSQAGFYIGTATDELGPVSRESMEYYRKQTDAEQALAIGSWTQRQFEV